MSILLIKRATDAVLDYIFAPSSGLGVGPEHPDIIECPFPDCGAPCNRSDVSDTGVCRYCGGYIAAWLGLVKSPCPMCLGAGRKLPSWETCPECDGEGTQQAEA